MNNDNYKIAKILSEDNSNLTSVNHLKDFFELVLNLVIVLLVIYFFIFILTDIFIKTMSLSTQIKIENALSSKYSPKKLDTSMDITKAIEVKNRIIKSDKNYPKTSNLNIGIIKSSSLNALCFPNGNIYITSELYKYLLKDEEMLTFVLAHEMGHYKHRDHLNSLRRHLANGVVLLVLSISSPKNSSPVQGVAFDVVKFTDMHHSRHAEKLADIYAAKILYRMFGSVDGGIKTLLFLNTGNIDSFDWLSIHPNTDNRIKYIKNLKYKYYIK